MCGIAGFANWHELVPMKAFVTSHGTLDHRGRDDEGFYVHDGQFGRYFRGDDSVDELNQLPYLSVLRAANLALGHRRLSIIDLTVSGHQPMESRTGRYVISYNGEIYNYLELREELRALGHDFKTDSDTEVLLTCLEEWGLDCLAKLNGMWAFAVIDRREKCLILSRDRLGIKPLFYSIQGRTLYFASEAKGLLNVLPAQKMNQARAVEYLVSSYVDHHEQTLFEGINQLLPGHLAIWGDRGMIVRRYWNLPGARSTETLAEAVERLDELLTSAISLRLRSDVPVGTLLSGGLDSTLIACTIADLRATTGSANGYDAFSAVFREEAFSERKYITETIRQTGLPVHWVYPAAEEVEHELPSLLYHQEFPFRSLSTFSQWSIMKEVATTPIKVLLNGQGSDELFAGYAQHYYVLTAQHLSRLRLGSAWRLIDFMRSERGASFSNGLRSILANWWNLSTGYAPRPFPRIDYLRTNYRPEIATPGGHDLLDQILTQNLTVTALPEYLRYEDRNSMAFTLESRLPYLDYRLVEWAMTLPYEMKIEGSSSKHVLREMARPKIPAPVADRTDKMGFVSPQEQWQRKELKTLLDQVFDADLQGIFPFLDGSRVRERYRRYQEQGAGSWEWVWRMACLYWWHQTWWSNRHGN